MLLFLNRFVNRNMYSMPIPILLLENQIVNFCTVYRIKRVIPSIWSIIIRFTFLMESSKFTSNFQGEQEYSNNG